MHETSALINFDKFGICKGCISSEQKMHINWFERQKKLKKIFKYYQKNSKNNYDCIIPISGGKDSAFQLYLLTKIYKLKPLAVTFSHNWFSKIGRNNLKNMTERLSVDLIEFTPNRNLVNKLAKKSLNLIGDSCWHCHTGVDAFPLQASVKFNIPLIVYGESIAEHSGKATYLDNPDYSIDYFLKYSSMVTVKDMLDKDISKKDLNLFEWPSKKDLIKTKTTRLHLADFIFWDAERQSEFVRDYLGWEEDHVEGTYKKYKSVECIMPGVHDYSKYLKRGFGRGTDFGSMDARAGIVTTVEAKKLAKKYDLLKPKILDYYLNITGYSESEFERTIKKHRKGKSKHLPDPSTMKQNNFLNDNEISDSVKDYISQNSEKMTWKKKIDNINNELLFPNFFDFKTQKIKLRKSNKTNLLSLSLKEKRDLIKNKKISISELCSNHLKIYDKLDKKIEAFTCLDKTNVFKSVKLLDDQIKKNIDFQDDLIGSFGGIKDVINTSDYKTEMGSKIWKNFHAGNDARCVFSLRKSSSIIVGKTQTAEFGIDEPPSTKNPFNVKSLVGTSSSGSAAAVSTRMVSYSLGTQTAASTIRPSSYCGIFGFKPSFGLIPRTGVLKSCDLFDHVTIMANSSEDVKAVLDSCRVKGKNYPFIYSNIDCQKEIELNVSKIKIAFVKTNTWDNAKSFVKNSLTNLVSKIANEKIIIDEIKLPKNFDDSHAIHEKIYSKSVSYYFDKEFKQSKSKLGRKTLSKIVTGKNISMDEFSKNIDIKHFLDQKLNDIFENYDFIICHSTADVAPKRKEDKELSDPSLIWAMFGLPSINVPSFSYNDMPYGFQIVGKKYDDYKIFKLLKIFEELGLSPKSSMVPELIKDLI